MRGTARVHCRIRAVEVLFLISEEGSNTALELRDFSTVGLPGHSCVTVRSSFLYAPPSIKMRAMCGVNIACSLFVQMNSDRSDDDLKREEDDLLRENLTVQQQIAGRVWAELAARVAAEVQKIKESLRQ